MMTYIRCLICNKIIFKNEGCQDGKEWFCFKCFPELRFKFMKRKLEHVRKILEEI